MLLLVNVDDITGEILPHVIDGLMARGANSAHVVTALTKKGRSGHLFFVDADAAVVDLLATYLASELGTLGVRVFEPRHIHFEYRFCPVVLQSGDQVRATVQVKQIYDRTGRVISIKAESDDLGVALTELARAGETLTFTVLKRLVEQAAAGQTECRFGAVSASYAG